MTYKKHKIKKKTADYYNKAGNPKAKRKMKKEYRKIIKFYKL